MKRLKKYLALMMVLTLALTVMTGCGAEKKTMFSVMKEASMIENYDYQATVKVDSSVQGLTNLEMIFNGSVSGNNISMGLEVKYMMFDVVLDQFAVVTPSGLYINTEEINSAVVKYTNGVYDLEELTGMKLGWVEFPYEEGIYQVSDKQKLVDFSVKLIEEAMKDIEIKSEKGLYSATIDGVEQNINVAKNYVDAVLNNKDEYKEIMSSYQISEDAFRKTVDIYVEAVLKAVKKLSDENDLGITEDDIASAREEASASIEEAFEDIDFDLSDDMSQNADEMFKQLEEAKSGLDSIAEEYKDAKITTTISDELTGKAGSRVYNMTLNADGEYQDDDMTVNITSKITENKDVNVTVPAEIIPFEDFLYDVMNFAYQSGLLSNMDDYLDIDLEDEFGVDTGDSDGAFTYVDDSSDNEGLYDNEAGTVTVTDIYTNDTYTLHFNPDVVVVDAEYSTLADNDICINAVNDEYCWLFIYYEPDTDITAEDYFEYIKTMYTDYGKESLVMSDVRYVDAPAGKVACMDVSYDTEYGKVQYTECALETNYGLFYTETSDFTEDMAPTVPLDEMLQAIFVDVTK